MAGSSVALNQRVRSEDPLVSPTIRKFIDRKTLWKFTPEGRHQIAVLEEDLYQLRKQQQAILRRESELTYMLHDLILQEKYLQLSLEQRDLAEIPETFKTAEQKEREAIITEGMLRIVETRDLMLIDIDIERETEEDDEHKEELEKLKREWEEMKMVEPTRPSQETTVTESQALTDKRKSKGCTIL